MPDSLTGIMDGLGNSWKPLVVQPLALLQEITKAQFTFLFSATFPALQQSRENQLS